MKYIDSEKLKAEIERLHKAHSGKYGCDEIGVNLEYLGGFTDSLQQEQPEVDLEEEIDSCWQDWISPSNQSSEEGVLPKSEFSMYARHFYELGLNARKGK